MDSNQNNHTVVLPLIARNQEQQADDQRNSTTCPVLEYDKKRLKKKFYKQPKFWLLMVFVLFVFVTTISLILYSHVYTDEDEKHFASSSLNTTTCTFTGFLNLSDSCLWDSWIQNETTFQNRITDVYAKSPTLQYYFIGANIDYILAEGNRSAIINLEFASPTKTSKYPISMELVEGILRQDMHSAGHPACPHSSRLLDAFQITSLDF